jgi:hypothetical protein
MGSGLTRVKTPIFAKNVYVFSPIFRKTVYVFSPIPPKKALKRGIIGIFWNLGGVAIGQRKW